MTHAPEGWTASGVAPFDQFVGPFYVPSSGGTDQYGFVADGRHANTRGDLHGGMIGACFDFALGMASRGAAGGRPCATVQMNLHYVGAGTLGAFTIIRTEIVRMTRTMVFARGIMSVGERTVAAGDGVWKILEPRATAAA